jgi:hypothetical protein
MLLCRSACPIQQLPYRFRTIANFVSARFYPLFASLACPGANSNLDLSSNYVLQRARKKRGPLSAGVSWVIRVSFPEEHNRAYTLAYEVHYGLESVHHNRCQHLPRQGMYPRNPCNGFCHSGQSGCGPTFRGYPQELSLANAGSHSSCHRLRCRARTRTGRIFAGITNENQTR